MTACKSNQEVAEQVETILLAVKPKIIDQVLKDLRSYSKNVYSFRLPQEKQSAI